MRVTINKHIVEVIQGDITDQDTEVPLCGINAANNHLWMGAGVAGAIKRKGGPNIEKEAVAQGPIEIGGAVMTTGGTLKAKFVIHAAAMGQDLHTDAEKIKKATLASLKLAEEKKISSISFPALGTGVGGFSPYHCAKIMVTEAVEFLQSSTSLSLVRFVLYDKETYDAFEGELKLEFSAKRR